MSVVETKKNPPKISMKFLDIDKDKADFAQSIVLQFHQTVNTDLLNNSGLARALKQAFDERYGPAWHCAVGSSFGSSVCHETNQFIFFHVENVGVMLFKSGDKKG